MVTEGRRGRRAAATTIVSNEAALGVHRRAKSGRMNRRVIDQCLRNKILMRCLKQMSDMSIGCLAEQGFGKTTVFLESGEATDFIYEVMGPMNSGIADAFNALSLSFTDRFALLTKHNCRLRYMGMHNVTFHDNLVLIDSYLPEMVGYALLLYYSDGLNNVADIVERMTVDNPLGYDLKNGHPFYSYKFKKFLTACALGMTPYNVWNGATDMQGLRRGVTEKDAVLRNYVFDRNEFEEFLLNSAQFETACNSQHGFGSIYQEAGKNCLKLRLQVRSARRLPGA